MVDVISLLSDDEDCYRPPANIKSSAKQTVNTQKHLKFKSQTATNSDDVIVIDSPNAKTTLRNTKRKSACSSVADRHDLHDTNELDSSQIHSRKKLNLQTVAAQPERRKSTGTSKPPTFVGSLKSMFSNTTDYANGGLLIEKCHKDQRENLNVLPVTAQPQTEPQLQVKAQTAQKQPENKNYDDLLSRLDAFEEDDNVNAADALARDRIKSPQKKSPECVICMDGIQQFGSTTCGHLFCYDCIMEWLKKKPNCPLCNKRCTKGSVRKIFMP